jgi:hypothetical protein
MWATGAFSAMAMSLKSVARMSGQSWFASQKEEGNRQHDQA